MDDSYIVEEYSSLLEQINEEITEGYIKESDALYIVRQKDSTICKGHTITPVVDFFFTEPELDMDMKTVKVNDAKKFLFEILGAISDNEESANLKEAVNMHISCLKDYTSNNNKRNEKDCYLVCVKESGLPMIIYFEEDSICKTLEKIAVGDLIKEIKEII